MTRIVLIALALVAVTGCGADYGTRPAAATSADTLVEMTDSSFSPGTVNVRVGDTVTFVDEDEIAHTATADGSFDSGTLREGGRFAFKATKAGTFDYVCRFHPGMTGRINVT